MADQMKKYDVCSRSARTETSNLARLKTFQQAIEAIGGTVLSTHIWGERKHFLARILIHEGDFTQVSMWKMIFDIHEPPKPDFPNFGDGS
jgi:hypothetical protein